MNYNGRAYLEKYLPSVVKNLTDNQELIVADNASTDDSLDFLTQYYPHIRQIRMRHNTGFAGGYNEALRTTDAEYFVLLNSDVEVTPDWLSPLTDYLDTHPQVAAVQPKILDWNQKDHFEYAGAAGGMLDKWGYPFCRGRIMNYCEKDERQYDTVQSVFWASGAAMIVRADLFKKIGGFDADYFAHMEEIDLCWRFKRAGYAVVAVPQSKVYHLGGGTLDYQSPQKVYLNFRNSLYTLFKNEQKRTLLWLLPFRLVLDGVAGVRFLSEGKWTYIQAIVRAHWVFFWQLPRWIQKRKTTKQVIGKYQIAPYNTDGRVPKSIVWAFFVQQKKTYQAVVDRP